VSLRGGLTEEDRLRAFVHAQAIKHTAFEYLKEKRRKLDKEGISDIVAEANKFYEEDGTHKTSAWSRFFRQIKKAGWDVSKVYIRDQGYRADICDQVDMDE